MTDQSTHRPSEVLDTLKRLGGRMHRLMSMVFPELLTCRASHLWGGKIGISRNRLPDIGQSRPGLYHAQGFSGHGVALTGLAGKAIAEAITGPGEAFDILSRVPHKPFPGSRILNTRLVATPLLMLVMGFAKLRDRF